MIKTLWAMIVLLNATAVLASTNIYVYNGETTTIKINPSGTILEFDKSIRVVGDSNQYKIEEIATSVDEKTNKPVNVKILKLIPKAANSTENVAIVLTGHVSFTLKLVASNYGEKQYRVSTSASNGNVAASYGKTSKTSGLNKSFLEEEIYLMKQMLIDEGVGFNREETDKKFELQDYGDKVDMRLVRIFEGRGLKGYSFTVLNRSEETIKLNPKTLQFGSPNMAVLMQIDHETLEPCSKNNSKNPSSNGCMAVMRLVLRDKNFSGQAFGSDMPFKSAE